MQIIYCIVSYRVCDYRFDEHSTMERYLTVTIERQGRGSRASASSSVLSTLSQPRDDDDDVRRVAVSRSRHSVDCSGMMTSSTPGPASPTSRSSSRLYLGVPSDLRRSSLQTDQHHHHHHHRRHHDRTCHGCRCCCTCCCRRQVIIIIIIIIIIAVRVNRPEKTL